MIELDAGSLTTSTTFAEHTAQPLHEARGPKTGVWGQMRPLVPQLESPAPVRRATPVALSMKASPIVESPFVVDAMFTLETRTSPRSHWTGNLAKFGRSPTPQVVLSVHAASTLPAVVMRVRFSRRNPSPFTEAMKPATKYPVASSGKTWSWVPMTSGLPACKSAFP